MSHLTYTVRPSDCQSGLEGIAQCFYGDTNRWVAIYEENKGVIGDNPTIIRAGQQLFIPWNGDAPTPLTPTGGTARLYVVQASDEQDGLPGIAKRLYGDRNKWREIYEANKGVVGDYPNVIQAGQQLVLP